MEGALMEEVRADNMDTRVLALVLVLAVLLDMSPEARDGINLFVPSNGGGVNVRIEVMNSSNFGTGTVVGRVKFWYGDSHGQGRDVHITEIKMEP